MEDSSDRVRQAADESIASEPSTGDRGSNRAAPGRPVLSAQGSNDRRQRLARARSSANWVSSLAQRSDRRVEPLRFQGSARRAMERLRQTVAAMPGSRIVEDEELYLHAEFTSRILRFVDDLELLLDEDAKQVHVRSASRVGHWDLGTNRRRVEALRARFEQSTDRREPA